MVSNFDDHRRAGFQQDQGRADLFHNQSEAMPASHFQPSLFGAASSLRPSWAISDDIFWDRYGTALRGTEGSWRALPHLKALSGQFHALNSAAGAFSHSFPVSNEDMFDGPSSAIDPWLLQPPPTGGSPSLAAGGRAQQAAASGAAHRRLLFQYKPYCQQDVLNLSEQDVAAVLEVAFGKIPYGAPKDDSATVASTSSQQATPRPTSSLRSYAGGSSTIGGGAGMNQTPADVACVVLVKLIMDLFLAQGPQLTFSIVHSMLQRALLHGDGIARARVFDVIMNLAVHGELLYHAPGDQVPEDDAAVVEAVAKLDRAGPSADWRHTVTSALRASLAAGLETPTSAAGAGGGEGGGSGRVSGVRPPSGNNSFENQFVEEEELEEGGTGGEWPPLPRPAPIRPSTAQGVIDPRGQRFRQWLRLLLFRMLTVLCSVSSPSLSASSSSSLEGAWAAAASCLAVLSTHEGYVVRSFTQEMPLEAAAMLLQHSEEQEWPHSLRCWFGCLAANLMYSKGKYTASNRGSVIGSGGVNSGNAQSKSLLSLDASRLKAFGGIRAVVRNYLDAPTLKCRRAFFCVMFDYLASDCFSGGGGGEEADEVVDFELEASLSQARSLLRAIHTFQIDALGAALLYTRAAEALCPILKLSFTNSNNKKNNSNNKTSGHPLIEASIDGGFSNQVLHDIAADITAQIAAVHALYPSQVVQPPPGVVEQCLTALLVMVAAAGVPASASATAAENGGKEEGEGEENKEVDELERLGTALKEGDVGADICLLRMVIEAADKEIVASAAAGRRHSVTLLPPPPQSVLAGDAGVGKKSSLSSTLEQALPDMRGHAAMAFMRAVHALLDYVQLATSDLGANTSSSTTSTWQSIDFPSVALQTLTSAIEWLNLAPPGARQRALAAAAERAVAVLTVRKIDPVLSSLDTIDNSTISTDVGTGSTTVTVSTQPGSNSQGGLDDATASAGRVAAAAAAEEGQPQQQQGQQQQAVGRVAGQPSDFNAAAENRHGVEQPGGHKQSSPLSKIMPVPKLTAAWRRLTNPHHGNSSSGAGGATASGGTSGSGISPGSDRRQQQQQQQQQHVPAPSCDVTEPIRPLSAGLSTLSGAERDAAAATAAAATGPGLPSPSPRTSQHSLQHPSQQPVYQPHRSRQFSSDVSLLSLAAERALYERHAAADAELACAEVVATAETKLTSIDSFLSGLSAVVPEILSQIPSEMLKSLLEGLRPEILSSPSTASGGSGSGGGGRSFQTGASESQLRASAVQAGRPLWDARAAIAILLLRQEHTANATTTTSPADTASSSGVDISFIASLLSDSDPRVRRHASTFILTRFAQREAQEYRIAVREVVAKAQRGDDDKILKSAEAQVKAMLDSRLMNLEGLV